MIRISVLGLVLAVSSNANCQQVMDGSDSRIPADAWNSAKTAILDILRDPYATQFDRLQVTSTEPLKFCGRFNAKNQAGGYEGFRPFSYNTSSASLEVNESNECGMALEDTAAADKTAEECAENTRQMQLYSSGGLTGRSLSELISKGKWCQVWYQQQIVKKIEKLGITAD